MRATRSIAMAATAAAMMLVCLTLGGEAAAQSAATPAEVERRVNEALDVANIKAVAEGTRDADVLMGLAAFAAGPVREETIARAREAAPERGAQIAAIFARRSGNVAGMGDWGDALVAYDPGNAYGYLIKALAAATAGQPLDATDMLRKAAAAERMVLPGDEFTAAVPKALDALGLAGAERVVAAMRMQTATQWSAVVLRQLPAAYWRCAQSLPGVELEGAADLMVAVAGQALRVEENLHARAAAQDALMTAFAIKAKAAREEGMSGDQRIPGVQGQRGASLERGYQRAREAVSAYNWRLDAGIESRRADRLANALYAAFRRRLDIAALIEEEGEVAEEARLALERAGREQQESAARFLAVLARDPDALLKAVIINGSEPPAWINPALWAEADDVVERTNRLGAAAELVLPIYANRQKLKQVGLAMIMYSNDHKGAFPESLEACVKAGYLRAPEAARSAKSGRPFIYAAGQMREDDPPGRIVAYDPDATAGGLVAALHVDGHVAMVPVERVEGMAGRPQP